MKEGTPPRDIAELETPDAPGHDGIVEEDNAIPRWFNGAFAASIVFAIVYLAYYTAAGWSARSQYDEELRAAASVARAVPEAETNPYHGNASAIADGQQVFAQICAACHKPDASGLVGPSLVDAYWKYGDSDHDRFETVMGGRPGGMPAWGAQLGPDKIWRVLAYLETLPKSRALGLGAPGYAPPAAAAAPGG